MKNTINFIICLLFGLMFMNAGLNKFFNYMPVPDDLPESMLKVMEAFLTIRWILPLVGIIEIIGGILFIIPKTRALGAIVIFPIMVGILLTHIVNAPSGLPIAAILFIINIWIMFENKDKYLQLINKA
ncbi:DoxX family membrane protein [Arenibacter sp. S6351L]|uniref:MauE/DoxX family redox-associated membrane protein n=1 Tax=Arenibacter sp. S6351L TaxID=2926407 RepID=UPI001FF216BA|nr:DoxX family membrane protein [Arenibacter sp. S6351L]MCK0136116.1 DoxX family protein [Arenibacter sp. S6351L]